MDITVKSFGTISDAEVHIGGLTVITGENDTGKSTIGKILFSLVKAFARYKEDLEEDKEARIMSHIEELYFTLRRRVNIATQGEIRDYFQPRRLYNSLRLDTKKTIVESLSILEKYFDQGLLPILLMDMARSNLHQVESILYETEDKKSAINRAIRKAFYSEFRGEILQKGRDIPQPASIAINDGASELIKISWSKDGMYNFDFDDDLGFNDATYVESPAIIQFHNLVRMSKTLFDNGDSGRLTVPLHLKDLSTKLSDSIYSFVELDIFPEFSSSYAISKKISEMFGGTVEYDVEKQDFVLSRAGVNIASSNIASGIKSLGILDLLVKGGNARKNSLLILDEPEVNLHPKWQVSYCELICDLVASGVDIIVTTHSPYVIEALKEFSYKSKIPNHFYLAYKDTPSGYSSFIDITDNIGYAIDLLAAPLINLNEDLHDDF
jgi:predicted ATP-dependent endonuclease of OLD family